LRRGDPVPAVGHTNERNLAYKDSMVVVVDDGGLRTVAVPEPQRSVAALDDGAVADLSRLGSTVRALFGDDGDQGVVELEP
jgi:hypothetical protein